MELTHDAAFLHLTTWMREQVTVCLLHKTPDGSVDASVGCTIATVDDAEGFSVQLQGDAGTLSFQTRDGMWAYAEMWDVALPDRYERLRCQALDQSPILGCGWPSGSLVTLVVLNTPTDESAPSRG